MSTEEQAKIIADKTAALVITSLGNNLGKMIEDALTNSTLRTIRDRCAGKIELTQSEAYEIFTEGRVKKWVKAGLIQRKKCGSKRNSPIFYSTARLLELMAMVHIR